MVLSRSGGRASGCGTTPSSHPIATIETLNSMRCAMKALQFVLTACGVGSVVAAIWLLAGAQRVQPVDELVLTGSAAVTPSIVGLWNPIPPGSIAQSAYPMATAEGSNATTDHPRRHIQSTL